MDFLKKLNLNDTPAPGSGAHPSATSSGHDIFNKLSGALSNHSQSQSTPAPAHPKEDSKSHSHRDLFNKIGSALAPQPTAHTQPANQAPENNNVLGKIGSALAAHSSSPSPNSQQAQQQSQQPKKEGGIMGSLSLLGSVVGGSGKQEKQKVEPAKQGLGDKINSALGGGRKAEEKEDTLDKAIDFVQEHVLKQGQQKNETAIEQLKDKQIADAIRGGFKNITGKEFPGQGKK
ncbi:hypothetical protein D9615_002072 [Tricholomella constricta]|uniref:Uncharacterized protein n=1 Tax=Tricholomella constricta TaxID=117010 RepID=A0A8H5HNS3_9AGAR|nr:hypothetical protein D9615_002072 [Tricholomella constricta]